METLFYSHNLEKPKQKKWALDKLKNIVEKLKSPNCIKMITLSLYASSVSALTGYFVGLEVSNYKLSKKALESYSNLDYIYTLIQQNYDKQRALLIALLLLTTYAGLGFPGLKKKTLKDLKDLKDLEQD